MSFANGPEVLCTFTDLNEPTHRPGNRGPFFCMACGSTDHLPVTGDSAAFELPEPLTMGLIEFEATLVELAAAALRSLTTAALTAWDDLNALPFTAPMHIYDAMAARYEIARLALVFASKELADLEIAAVSTPAKRPDFSAHCAIEYTTHNGETLSSWDIRLGLVISMAYGVGSSAKLALKYRHGGTRGGTWSRPFRTVRDFLDAILAEVAETAEVAR